MTARFHVTLECEGGLLCQSVFHWHSRYATEARAAAAIEGWTLIKGRGPNTYHDRCPDHAAGYRSAEVVGDQPADPR
jgi:hypothetical protein